MMKIIKSTEKFERLVLSGSCPVEFELIPAENPLTEQHIQKIFEVLRNPNCPVGKINLSRKLTQDLIPALKDALDLGKISSDRLEIDLSHNDLTSEHAGMLMNSLLSCAECIDVDLEHNQFGPTGAAIVTQAVQSHAHLKELYLNLSSNQLGATGAKSIIDICQINSLKTLTLALNNNEFGPEGAKFIAEGLKKSKNSPWLYLEENNFGDEGVQEISRGLIGSNKNVRFGLFLGNNNFSQTGFESVIEAISYDCFDMLGLNHDFISSKMAELLASTIQNKIYPENFKLNFTGCRFDVNAITIILKALSKQTLPAMACLSFANCDFTKDELYLLCDMLKTNKQVQIVDIRQIKIALSEGDKQCLKLYFSSLKKDNPDLTLYYDKATFVNSLSITASRELNFWSSKRVVPDNRMAIVNAIEEIINKRSPKDEYTLFLKKIQTQLTAHQVYNVIRERFDKGSWYGDALNKQLVSCLFDMLGIANGFAERPTNKSQALNYIDAWRESLSPRGSKDYVSLGLS